MTNLSDVFNRNKDTPPWYSTPGSYTEVSITYYRGIYSSMFVAAGLTIAREQKQQDASWLMNA